MMSRSRSGPSGIILFCCLACGESSIRTQPESLSDLMNKPDPLTHPPIVGFAPPWEPGQRWNVDYEWTFRGKATRRHAPPFVYTTSWTYEVGQADDEGRVKIKATSHVSVYDDCEIMFFEDGNLVARPKCVGGAPAQRGLPFLAQRHRPTGGLVAAWPIFPLQPGLTQEFPERGMSQTVAEEGDALRIYVSVRRDPTEPYPRRYMEMVWKRGEPWWSTVELRTELTASSGPSQFGVIGRVLGPGETPADPLLSPKEPHD